MGPSMRVRSKQTPILKTPDSEGSVVVGVKDLSNGPMTGTRSGIKSFNFGDLFHTRDTHPPPPPSRPSRYIWVERHFKNTNEVPTCVVYVCV